MSEKVFESLHVKVGSMDDTYINNPKSTAPQFSASKAYAAGDYVYYNRKLYRFTAAHAAGAWTGSDASEATVSGELSAIKADLTQMKYEVTNTALFESGAINGADGNNYASSKHLRSISSFSKSIIELAANDGYSFLPFAYSNGAYVGCWKGSSFSTGSSGATYVTSFSLVSYPSYDIRIAIKRTDGTNITVNEASNVVLSAYKMPLDSTLTMTEVAPVSKTVGDSLNRISNLLHMSMISMQDKNRFLETYAINGISEFTEGKALNNTGDVITEASSYCTENYMPVDYIGMSAFSEVALTTWEDKNFYHWICFYTESKTFISRIGGNKYKIAQTSSIPQTAKYFRVTLSYVGINNVASYSLSVGIPNGVVIGSPKSKWYVLGDSISAGYYSMTVEEAAEKGIALDYYPDNIQGVGSKWDSSLRHNYWGYANEWYLHHDIVSLAHPGQGYIRAATPGNGIDVVSSNSFSDASLITVAWGFNDWHYNKDRGDHNLIDQSIPYPTENYDTTQLTTINHAIWYCLGELIRKAPNAKIVVQTPMNGWAYGGDFASNWAIGTSLSDSGTLADIHDDIKYWADYYGLQVLEMTYNNSCVNRRNIQTALIDGSHPSDITHMQLARTVWARLGF